MRGDRIEIVADRRRRHDPGFRAMVIAEASRPGASVRDLARRHGICPSLIYRWRRQPDGERSAAPGMRLLPVRLRASDGGLTENTVPAGDPAVPSEMAGLIRIDLRGGVRVTVDEHVSAAALRRVLSALSR
jgi:transposase